MKIILQERVTGLGNLGDMVEVKAGYARNYLIPTGRATEATKKNIERFESRRAELEKQQAQKLADAEKRVAAFNGKVLTIVANVGDEGKLYGSISSQNIVEAAKKEGLDLARSEVLLHSSTIREAGEFPIELRFFGDNRAEIIVRVVGE